MGFAVGFDVGMVVGNFEGLNVGFFDGALKRHQDEFEKFFGRINQFSECETQI